MPLLLAPSRSVVSDIVVGDPPILATIWGHRLVGDVFRVACDDVPGVDETGDEAETAEGDVDE